MEDSKKRQKNNLAGFFSYGHKCETDVQRELVRGASRRAPARVRRRLEPQPRAHQVGGGGLDAGRQPAVSPSVHVEVAVAEVVCVVHGGGAGAVGQGEAGLVGGGQQDAGEEAGEAGAEVGTELQEEIAVAVTAVVVVVVVVAAVVVVVVAAAAATTTATTTLA